MALVSRISESGQRTAHEPEFLRRRIDRYFRERVEETWDGGHIMLGRRPGSDAIRLVSNDYLSMARNPNVLRAQRDALVDPDTELMAAVFLHDDSEQAVFEASMARWLRSEAAVLTQSGWSANTGLLQAIVDPDVPCYIDMFAHMSLWQGIRDAGAVGLAFRHNDVEHLDKTMRRAGPGIVIVDSVYSTSGSVAPLTDIVDVAERHGSVVVVDEAHSLGTHGPEGRGLVVELGLEDRVHFRTASLAKAFAGRAGLITCSGRVAEFIKYNSNPAIFSSGLLPNEIAGLEATRREIAAADLARARLHAHADYLRRHLLEMGYNVSDSQAQIIGLEAGTERQVIVLRDALESRGVFGSVFCAPATPKNRALVRLTLNSSLAREDLDRIIDVCWDIRDEVDLANWSSTRRLHRTAVQRELAALAIA